MQTKLPCRLIVLILYLSLIVGWSAPSTAADDTPPRKKVLLIGIDGCRPDALQAANAPSLQGLAKQGAMFTQTQTGADTVSAPGWSSMLTGVWADKHGVHDNGLEQFKKANYDEYPHFFARVRESLPDAYLASIVHWQPIQSIVRRHANFSGAPGKDERVEESACRMLREKDPTVLFLHFDDVDSAGHAKGFHPSVAEYVAAIEKVDGHVGNVLSALRHRTTFANEDWLILVSTDHGGQGTGHGGGAMIPEIRTIFIIASGPAVDQSVSPDTETYVVDVAATALAHLGITIQPEWKLDGKPVGLKHATQLSAK